ncbi:MAG: glycosyltransferase family 4 protein [Pirellula sp.]|jgi:glycosyltransferase involved in cell wall biosynthesis
MRILLIAEACNPEWASVPLEGWSHSQAIAALPDVQAHLVTQIRNQDAILRAGLRESVDFTAIDSEAVMRPAYKLASLLRGGSGKGWTTVMALSSIAYPYFEHLVWKQFAARIRSGEFDIVHRLTPLSPTAPSLLAKRCFRAGVPFVLGPLNGGVPWPKQFDTARRREKEWLSYVRGIYKALPGYRSTRKYASAILCGSKATLEQMPSWCQDKCHYIPENAVDPARFSRLRLRTAQRPIRCVFLGRLVPYKGPDMLLEAMAPLLVAGDVTLQIIGDGPMLPELQQFVASHQLPGVSFLGWVEHQQVQNCLVDADLLTFPSIREFGGGVVLEAMALGVPAVVVDYGGPAELVTTETGWTIPLADRSSLIQRLRQQIAALVAEPTAIDTRGNAARKRALEQFTWSAKAKQVRGIYEILREGVASSKAGESITQPAKSVTTAVSN